MDLLTTNQSETSADIELELEYEIEEDIEAELENFVRLNHTGQFEDAHELFDECLSSHDDWYPIAAEYADCLLREGKFKQLADFSRKASRTFQEPGEKTLLLLMKVIGNCAPRDIMRQQLQALWPIDGLKPPYTSLEDTDIHILELILLALVLTGMEPKDLEASLTSDGVFEDPWSVFKDCFYRLLRNELFWEAQRILQSLLHVISWTNSQIMVRAYIRKAVSTNIGEESVQIAVSSLVQRSIYVAESRPSSPLAVVPWNDAITWALFGVTLTKKSEDSTSLFNCIFLRRSLEEEFLLGLGINLPLNGVQGNDEISGSLYNAISNGDVGTMSLAMRRLRRYSLNEGRCMALLKAAQRSSKEDVLKFLDSDTVHARDGFQRTAFHWAASKCDWRTIVILLKQEKADPGSLDWFGFTPLHYAVKKSMDGERYKAARSLVNFDAATVNTKDLSGLGPLHMAILNDSHDIATLLVRYGATMETSDMGALPPFGFGIVDWDFEYSKYQIAGNRSDSRDSSKTFREAGHDTESIEKIPKREGKEKNVKDLKAKDLTRPMYIKVHQKHVSPDTCFAYKLPWEWDPRDTNFIIIKQWIPEGDQLVLFEHTKKLKEEKIGKGSPARRVTSPQIPLTSFQPSNLTLIGAQHGALSKRLRSDISDIIDPIRYHSREKSSNNQFNPRTSRSHLLADLKTAPKSSESEMSKASAEINKDTSAAEPLDMSTKFPVPRPRGGGWVCHECRFINSLALSPETCPGCQHHRCVYCS